MTDQIPSLYSLGHWGIFNVFEAERYKYLLKSFITALYADRMRVVAKTIAGLQHTRYGETEAL